MRISGYGVLCLTSTKGMMIIVQAPSGNSVYILETPKQIARLVEFFKERPVNKFIPLPANEAEECIKFLNELKQLRGL